MGLESPVGGSVHTGGSESALDADLILASLNIIRDLLQVVKALDILQLVTCFLQKADIGDNTVGLDDISDTVDCVTVFKCKRIGSQVAHDL